MTLETIYYIGQSFAVLALICSLLFVGYQVRQSRLIERAAAQRELLNGVISWSRRIAEYETMDDFIICMTDYEAAGPKAQFKFDSIASEFVFLCESALNMHRDGFFSDGTWLGIEGGVLALLRTPGGQQFWQYGRTAIGPEIVEHLERKLAVVDPSTPTFLDVWPAIRRRSDQLQNGEK